MLHGATVQQTTFQKILRDCYMKKTNKTPLLRSGKSVGSRSFKSSWPLFGLAAASLLLVQQASATVTVQGWWHLDSIQPINDSSGNSRNFGSAYSTAPGTGGQFGGQLINNGAGGPLGTTAYTSAQCVQLGVGIGGKRQSAMWGLAYNPPAVNYGIEIWAMPQDNGIAGGSGGWIFSSGQGGGVALRINAPSGAPSYIDAYVLGDGSPIGNQVEIDTNRWMHLAIVNNNGTLTFYTNGIACGASFTGTATTPAGDVYIGTPNDNQAYYGYLDEARMFTFAPGGFTTNDLLLRPPGPNLIGQPQNAIVWNGGAAPFSVTASFDNSLTYQWRGNGTNLPGMTTPKLYLNTVSLADSGRTFDCIVTGSSISRTSSVATLSVVANNPANVAAYRSAINAEPSLVAYFPTDSDTGATLTNTKDATHNGTLELAATFDGRTNDTFGARSLSFNLDGDVQIPNNPAFEFSSGFGTIEAVIYLSQATVTAPIIFAEAQDGGSAYYSVGASANGTSLVYSNDATGALSWAVPGGLIGKLAHVAVVIDNGVNVTAYVNGQNLGTKIQAGFGSGSSSPAWIGGVGSSVTDNRWAGTADEVAIYSSALSQNTIQIHYSKFVYGTNTSAPTIVSQPASKTILAGASPVLLVTAGGTLPLTYQWTKGGSPVAGATTASLSLSNVNASATYQLWVTNAYGFTNTQPIVLTAAAPNSPYTTVAMADHPTALWRLAESSGTTAVDSAGFNDGTYEGGFTLGGATFHGESGTAVNLNGSSGRAIVPLTSVLNPAGPFTCEFWAATAAQAFYVPVGSMDRPGRSGGYEFYNFGNYAGYEFHTAVGGGYGQITGHDTAPVPGEWSHVVGVYDGTNIILYVDGALASDPTYADPTFTPNSVKGFYIGSRADNVRFFNGRIADVAFYNYALSALQISNHYAVTYQAASIVTQPVGVTNVEGSTISLSVTADGLPNSYQWQKLGVGNLSPVNNFDGTAHYPLGLTGKTLQILQAQPADSGQYRVVISNPLGGATSAYATVLITPDTNAPAISAVVGLGTPNNSGPTPYLVKVIYNKRMDPTTAGDAAKYSFNPPVTVSSVSLLADTAEASLGADWHCAYLVTSGLTPGQKYALTVTGVKDQAQTPNTIVPVAKYFRAPLLSVGAANWDYYYIAATAGSGVIRLQSDVNYPNAPQTNAYVNVFNSGALYSGNDLNNNPAFGSLGDNYGSVLSAWITPTVSGDYTFFLASDDASQLYLSTSADPSLAAMIAEETGCCHPFMEPIYGMPQTSNPQTLTAGASYFIKALHAEGGGGDWVKVAWRISTDTSNSTNLPPIASSFLSAYAPVAPPVFGTASLSGGTLTIPWTGYQGVMMESTDLVTWTPVPGNPNPLVITVSSAPKKFYRIAQ